MKKLGHPYYRSNKKKDTKILNLWDEPLLQYQPAPHRLFISGIKMPILKLAIHSGNIRNKFNLVEGKAESTDGSYG